MTAFEVIMILVALASPITTIIGGLMVIHGSYKRMQTTVKMLVDRVAALEPQTAEIADLSRVYAEMAVRVGDMQRDIKLIKSDLGLIRDGQQKAAYDRPEKGELDDLKTKGK